MVESVSTSLQPGYILHYREYQDASFIVDAFTLTHGRVSLFARSARQSRPAVRALYQPFRPLLLSWVGSGDLRTLTGIEDSGKALDLQHLRLACGYYINELVLRLLGKDEPNDAVFAYYALALSELAQPELDHEAILRIFELQLLDVMAVLPDFTCCTSDGSAIEPELEYHYHPANALAVAVHRLANGSTQTGDPSVHPDGMTRDKGVRVHGKTLIALHNLDVSEREVLVEARTLMRQILRIQLGDKPLKSRELFASLVAR